MTWKKFAFFVTEVLILFTFPIRSFHLSFLLSYDIKKILLAGFFACGGTLQRHNSSPPQYDPAQRAFYIIGISTELPVI